jgi:hypothetical protein
MSHLWSRPIQITCEGSFVQMLCMFALYSDPTRLRKRQRMYEKVEYSTLEVIEKSRLCVNSRCYWRCLQGSLHAR